MNKGSNNQNTFFSSLLRYLYVQNVSATGAVIRYLHKNTVVPRLTSDPANEFFG